MRINELTEIKTTFNRLNATASRFKSSSMDPVIKYLESHMDNPDVNKVADLIGDIPADKRVKYKAAIQLIAKYVLLSQPEAKVIIGVSSDRDALAAALADLCINNKTYADILTFGPKANVQSSFKMYMAALTLERDRVLYTQKHQMNLMAKLKDGSIALTPARIMNPAAYGAGNAKDAYTKAALFVAHASSSFSGKDEKEQASIVSDLANQLRDMVAMRFRINSAEGVLKLHEQLVGKFVAGKNIRTMNYQAAVPTLSDKMGHSMMLLGLRNIEKFPVSANLGLYICGEIINAHGFVDGNGRAARSALALCQLLATGGQTFDAPTEEYDKQLHGLDHAHA